MQTMIKESTMMNLKTWWWTSMIILPKEMMKNKYIAINCAKIH